MKTHAMRLLAGLLASGLALIGVSAQAPAGAPPASATVSPAEIQRMFDGMALLQAQEQLGLTNDQFTQFMPRYKALQDVRRRAQNERMRIIQELRRLSLDSSSEEGQMRESLKALQDLEARSATEIRRALDGVDQVLDVRQQAHFRAFEENMERRKLELVAQARQNNRLNGRGQRGRQ